MSQPTRFVSWTYLFGLLFLSWRTSFLFKKPKTCSPEICSAQINVFLYCAGLFCVTVETGPTSILRSILRSISILCAHAYVGVCVCFCFSFLRSKNLIDDYWLMWSVSVSVSVSVASCRIVPRKKHVLFLYCGTFFVSPYKRRISIFCAHVYVCVCSCVFVFLSCVCFFFLSFLRS